MISKVYAIAVLLVPLPVGVLTAHNTDFFTHDANSPNPLVLIKRLALD